jgi:hypothetical protein
MAKLSEVKCASFYYLSQRSRDVFHKSTRTGRAPRSREFLLAMEELQKVRAHPPRVFSLESHRSLDRSRTPTNALLCPKRANRTQLINAERRPPDSPSTARLPHLRRSASAWSRCARRVSASSERFVSAKTSRLDASTSTPHFHIQHAWAPEKRSERSGTHLFFFF